MYSLFAEGGKYVGLASLDLICDTEESFKEWTQGVSTSTSISEEVTFTKDT